MSYILEALKKAQAERQLGSAPTIHALPIQPAAGARSSGSRLPLWIGIGVGTLLIGAAAFMWWRQQAGVAPGQVAIVLPAQAPAAPPVVVAPAAPLQPAVVAPPVAAPPAPSPAPVPVARPPLAAAPAAPRLAAPAPVPVPVPVPEKAPAPARAPAPAPAPEPLAAAAEESLPFMRELPQSVQQGLPQVAFGGYMYSKNPADRLLLIDKVLRHEGEEVAPGLVLEKLLPRAAVMNYRGTRYRVAY